MKGTGNLYEKICAPDNLGFAFIKAKRSKEIKPGVYKYSKHLNKNLNKLCEPAGFLNPYGSNIQLNNPVSKIF